MNSNFADYRVDDGYIQKLCIVDGNAQVYLLNWREEREIIIFQDVIGLEAYSFTNTSLSHVAEISSDSLLERSTSIEGIQPTEFRCYAFFSAWTNLPILKIVARSFIVKKETSDNPIE
jgi:hypothetical protein